MITLSSQVRIQNKQGGEISTVSLDKLLGRGAHSQPGRVRSSYYLRTLCRRFVFVAEANPDGTNSGLLVAVSQSTDPTGNWNRLLHRCDTSFPPVSADSPHVGFNKDWIRGADRHLPENELPSLGLIDGDFMPPTCMSSPKRTSTPARQRFERAFRYQQRRWTAWLLTCSGGNL